MDSAVAERSIHNEKEPHLSNSQLSLHTGYFGFAILKQICF